MAKDETPSGEFGRDALLKIYQQHREAALGMALASAAKTKLGLHSESIECDWGVDEHSQHAARLHAMLWPRDPDPEALCSVPDLLEVFQVVVAALEHCNLFTDAPEKAATLQFLAPYIERASQWIGHDRITAGLASLPKVD